MAEHNSSEVRGAAKAGRSAGIMPAGPPRLWPAVLAIPAGGTPGVPAAVTAALRNSLMAMFMLFLTVSIFAQETGDVEKLRATVEQLQKTVDDLQQRIRELEADKAKRDAGLKQIQEQPLVTDYNTMADQQVAAPRPDNEPIDPELKGFIPIPGTVSMFKIGGSARVDTIYDTDDNGVPNWFQPSSMPVEGEPGYESGGRTALHAKGTRVSAEFRHPSGKSGNLRIFYENDFFGDPSSSTMTYRMRHFYGQASNFLVGQTYSGFENVDSWPDVVDYLGPNAIVNKRQAQIRYTHPLGKSPSAKRSWYVSAEVPSTEVNITDAFPAGSRPVNRLPDFVAGYRVERKNGHVQIAALGRSLTVEAPDGARLSTTGWGINVAGAINLLEGDRVSYQLLYGKGIGRYLNDTNGQDLDAAPGSGGGLEAVPILAPVIGYGHRWSDSWRSTISYSFVDVNANPSLGGSSIDKTRHGSVNLIYQPTKQFRLGLEYIAGDKKTASGAKGDARRLDFVVRYDLVK